MVTPVGETGIGVAREGSSVLTAAIRRAGWGCRANMTGGLSVTAGEYLFPPNNSEKSTPAASFTAEKNNSLSIHGIKNHCAKHQAPTAIRAAANS